MTLLTVWPSALTERCWPPVVMTAASCYGAYQVSNHQLDSPQTALSQKADSFGIEPICVWNLEKLGNDPKQAIDQLYLGENVALFRPFHLPFSDHVHCLVACQCAVVATFFI